MKAMTNEELIWKYLYEKIRNVYGVAGLMGNLFAESSLNPKCATGAKKLGLTNDEYTAIVDSHKNDNFITDGIAYGLVQWCYKTRKQGLLELAKERNVSVGDLLLQLDYLWIELNKYSTVLTTLYNATNIKQASDVVMLKYEKPANTSEAAKEKRIKYAEKYYKKYGEPTIQLNVSVKTANELWKVLEGKMLTKR